MPSRVRILSSETVFRGKILQVKVDRIIEPGGVKTTREIVHHSGSVVVLPRFPDERLLLVRQYRYAAKEYLWELVAGGIEPGESAALAARRELLEEAGYHARAVKPLLKFYPSPGFLTETMYLTEARGLTLSKAQPEEDERIEVRRFTPKELVRMLRAGEIRDAKTLVGVLWLFGLHHEKGSATL